MLGLERYSPATRGYVLAVIAAGLVALLLASVPVPAELDLGRLFFWIAITWVAAALPVRLPGGVYATITTAPVLASVFDPALPNPFAACWVAFIGTFEPRDVRRELPWFGTLFNRAEWVLSALASWYVLELTRPFVREGDPFGTVAQIVLVGTAFAAVNDFLTVTMASVRDRAPISRIWALSIRNVAIGLISQVPLGWLMAEIAAGVGQWAAILFIVPLLLARYSFSKYTETRDLFYGSVSALSQAIDAKDGFTRGHADRVSRIAGAIAREMGLPEKNIEQIELA
ncbi:MAG TPA: hypothetical protein VFM93_11945, partial [Candidatus Limnocylindria bacterium]|nr:hypothetical protein [Candidatus Limnocylindria bacterium]